MILTKLGRLNQHFRLLAVFSSTVTLFTTCSSSSSAFTTTSSSSIRPLSVSKMTTPASSSSSTTTETRSVSRRCGIDYPELVVFDADACLWDQEMYEMPAIPGEKDVVQGNLNGKGEGVIATISGGHEIRLHKGSLLALQEHAENKYPGMKVCIASSADTPFAEKIARANLKLLEVVPGTTVWDLLMRDWDDKDVNQIGRQPPLSSNKARSHFPRLKEATGIRYDRMLFFDDCLWGDHCGMVASGCKEADSGVGPAICRTPNGLGVQEWQDGLAAYKKHGAALMNK